jgi:GH24 family phage-related lysozyme (muramidase)
MPVLAVVAEGLPFPQPKPACDPSMSSCTPGTAPKKCDTMSCIESLEARAAFEKDNNCKFEPNPLCKPIDGMSVSSGYLEKLAIFEGKVPQYYNDSNCNCTAGVGHLIHYGQCEPSLARNPRLLSAMKQCTVPNNILWSSRSAFPGAAVSNEQIKKWLNDDLAGKVAVVKRIFSGKKVTQNEFDALVDLAYNGGFSRYYSIKNDILINDYIGAISENSKRGLNNGLPSNRVSFENFGLRDGNVCK